jgi:4'-phosphopantetheinyl transferase
MDDATAAAARSARAESSPVASSIGHGDVHIWLVRPDDDGEAVGQLSESERVRAGRFRFAEDRRRWAGVRASLRRILAAYTGVSPAAVQIGIATYGKPCVLGPGSDWLRFNVSHAGDLGLIAVSHGHEVGVDLERWPRRPGTVAANVNDLANGCLTVQERSAFEQVDDERERVHRFLCFWTAKEALLKAEGVGLLGRSPAEVPIPVEVVDHGWRGPVRVGSHWLWRLVVPHGDADCAVWAAALAVAGELPARAVWMGSAGKTASHRTGPMVE